MRREPHQVLFPLGVALAGIGVLPWILFALGLTEAYRPIFHSVVFRSMFHPLAEIEGFLTCFAIGFLFTVLPRRTATAPPTRWQMAVAVAAPLIIVISAALRSWAVGQIAWLILIGVATEFSLARLKGLRLPPGSIWIAVAIVMGALGAVLAIVGEASGQERLWLHEVGRALLTQGLFTGLVLGTAGLLFGTSEVVAEPGASRRHWAFAAHSFGAALFLASFWIDSARLGFALRAAVTFAVVLSLARATLLPNPREIHRRGARTAIWMVPLGNAWAALAPTSRRAGMHVIYIACFAMLVLVLSGHVSAPITDRPERPEVRLWQIGLGAAFLAVALAARILVEVDPPSFNLWLGIACAAFVGATLFTLRSFIQRIASLLPDRDQSRLAPPR